MIPEIRADAASMPKTYVCFSENQECGGMPWYPVESPLASLLPSNFTGRDTGRNK